MQLKPNQKQTYPTQPGVYKMLNDLEQIIYIGKAKNLQKRLTNYFDKSVKSQRIKIMVSEIKSIEVTVTLSENDALVLEQKLINKIKPKYNIIFRDDKSYPFIALSKHSYPKIYITREKKTKDIKDNLFGPYPKKEYAYKNLEFIQNIFKLRTCTDNEFAHRSRPCILHSIGKCSAPCINQSNPQFQESYQYNVNQAKKILKGEVSSTLKSLNQKMGEYSQSLQFEEAAKTRDIIQSLEELTENQHIYSLNEENILVFNYLKTNTDIYLGYTQIIDGLPQEVFSMKVNEEYQDSSIEELLTTYIETEIKKTGVLQIITPIVLPDLFYDYKGDNHKNQHIDWLQLVKNNLNTISEDDSRKKLDHINITEKFQNLFTPQITSIECIDISHFQGEATYGGKVNWTIKSDKGYLNKNKYRLAKMEDGVIDDVLHIYKTVDKIYHTQLELPSILIIDGDKAQLESAYKALTAKSLNNDCILISSAKGIKRKKGEEIIYIHKNSLHLINTDYIQSDILNIPSSHPFRLLLQNLQDTAHNFSNSARSKKMSKTRFKK
jgi:excinuclease ABC subunit C